MNETTTRDRLEKWDLWIEQPRRGYRFSVDSLILSEFCRLRPGERILDLGTGSGVIALILARRDTTAMITALEIQPGLAGLARKNVKANGLEGRVSIVEGDINEARKLLKAGGFDHVVSNPPYRPPGSGRLCLESQEALARHEILTRLEGVVAAARHALRPGGRFSVIYPAERASTLLTAMTGARLEPKRLCCVHHRLDEKARLIVVEGCKDAGVELTITAPLILSKEGHYK